MKNDEYLNQYWVGFNKVMLDVSLDSIKRIVKLVGRVKKQNGRIFILGVGGSAANSSHAANDFRKMCDIEAYSPTDNVAELTARINDNGWDSSFVEWLKVSKLHKKDLILVLSVGGGSVEKNVSSNIVKALDYAKERGSKIVGFVSRDGGYTKLVADEVVLISVYSPQTITPFAESMQALIWHAITNHPDLKSAKT